MGLDRDQSYYVDMLCSFEPGKFDPKWIRHVRFSSFGQEVLSRFGLGVAGYRMFSPFKIFACREDAPQNIKTAAAFARNVSTHNPTWGIHPITRAPETLSRRGNLNKNLGNLILEAFTTEQIDQMVANKAIFAKPVHDPLHRNYTQWTEGDDISGTLMIFPAPE